MTVAVTVLMIITSMGIFGFLSKAHSDQSLVSGDVLSKIAIYDEKIKTARENIEANRKQLKQMDEAFDQVMGRSSDEKGADKANNIRRSQQRDRANLAKDIEANQKIISQLNDESAPIRAEVRKVEAEVGPIKYIAKFVYGDHGADENMLEKAVTWIIILIVVVFDPLAVIMLLAAQMTFQWHRDEKNKPAEEPGPMERTVFEPKETLVEDDSLATDQKDTKDEYVWDRIGQASWPFPSAQAVDPEEMPHVMSRQWTKEEVAALAQTTDSDPDTTPLDIAQPDPIEQWNTMLAAAEKEAAEEAAKWAEENKSEPEAQEAKEWAQEQITPEPDFPPADESKKKDELYGQTTRQDGNQREEVGYVQNSEQGNGTLWSRIQERSNVKIKDELYKLYGQDKFESIEIDATIDPELAKFVEETKTKGPKFSNYPQEKLRSFVERIYELRKNQSNNTAG